MRYAAILAAMCCPLDAYAAHTERFIPDCAGAVAIAHGRVARVERDGTLVLRDGRALTLQGLRLSLTEGNQLPGRTLAVLQRMAFAGPVNFTTMAPATDRYGRIRVQAFGESWFQTALLDQGLARVQIAPDRQECAPDLYEAEALARDRHVGLWASPDALVRTPQTLANATGTFQVVEGTVSGIGRGEGRTSIIFGNRHFFATVEPQDRRAFRDFDFDALSGRRIRVRGVVQDDHGRPQIQLSTPYQVELVE